MYYTFFREQRMAASVKEFLYDRLVDTIKRMRRENKFNLYSYKFNPLVGRGTENGNDRELDTSAIEKVNSSSDKDGNILFCNKTFDLHFSIFDRSAYVPHVYRPKKTYRMTLLMRLYQGPNDFSLSVQMNLELSRRTFDFPAQDYLENDGLSVEEILRKFEDEYMEVPLGVHEQHVDMGEPDVEFMRPSPEQLLQAYESIQRYYDTEYQRRTTAIHALQHLDTDLIRKYIFPPQHGPIDLNEIPALRLNTSFRHYDERKRKGTFDP